MVTLTTLNPDKTKTIEIPDRYFDKVEGDSEKIAERIEVAYDELREELPF